MIYDVCAVAATAVVVVDAEGLAADKDKEEDKEEEGDETTPASALLVTSCPSTRKHPLENAATTTAKSVFLCRATMSAVKLQRPKDA